MLSVKSLHTDYAAAGGAVVNAVQDVSFDVPDGELFTLLGPSGCGKTTTLRSIAGLERPRSGSIALDGRVVYSSDAGIFVAPNRRNFGMVFQSYAIWPHMNVFKNVAFPLEVRKARPSRKEIEQKVMRVLATVQLAELVDRDATKLSGGQQQRLALARALVMEPQLLLLDEPLSNLDAKLREAMRFEFKRMQRDLGLTTIYVTHDQSEALALSHEIAVMSEGRIVQIGSPRDIYERPRNKFVADFVGSTNFIGGRVASAAAGNGRCRVATALGELNVQCVEPLAKDMPVVDFGAARGRRAFRGRRRRARTATMSAPVSSRPKSSSATIWISRSKWAILCYWPASILRCGRRSVTPSTCACGRRNAWRLRSRWRRGLRLRNSRRSAKWPRTPSFPRNWRTSSRPRRKRRIPAG